MEFLRDFENTLLPIVDLTIILYVSAMIQERASLPKISLQPVVAGAARKTSRAVGQATKSFMNLISRREDDDTSEKENKRIDYTRDT